MKNPQVQKSLKQLATQYTHSKKAKPATLVEKVVGLMDAVGGLTGLRTSQNSYITLQNHNDAYTLPLRMSEHTQNMSRSDKKKYQFLESLRTRLLEQGVSPRNIEYHLGAHYSSKHHNPFK